MGVGAGYTLTVKDLDFDFSKIVIKRNGDKIEFELPIVEGRYSFNADHSYWGFDGTAKMSGIVKGTIDRKECDTWDFYGECNANFFGDDEKVTEYIRDDFDYYGKDFHDVFSAGWIWCEPCEKWQFVKEGYSRISDGNIDIYSAEICSQEMADKVSYWHDSSEDEEFDCYLESDYMKEEWCA